MTTTKTVFERVRAELTSEEGNVYKVELVLEINKAGVNENADIVKRILIHYSLAPRSGDNVPDGNYTLIFMFDGTQQKKKVRKSGRSLLHRQ